MRSSSRPCWSPNRRPPLPDLSNTTVGAARIYAGISLPYEIDDGDRVDGGSGDDVILGSTGPDILYGGPGDDDLYGEAEADSLHGDEGADSLYCGDGEDVARGGTSTTNGVEDHDEESDCEIVSDIP